MSDPYHFYEEFQPDSPEPPWFLPVLIGLCIILAAIACAVL